MKISRETVFFFLRSLSVQFLIAGGLVMLVAAYVVGTWVANRIEQGVVQNTGVSAALYIESLLPAQTRGPDEEATISENARLALRQVFQEGILSERVVTYNIWGQNGEILDSYSTEQRGSFYEPSEALLLAWSGEVASQFQTLLVQADHPEATLGIPLLEVYVPIRDARTGEILVVVEFYQRAEDLAAALMNARRDSWTLVSQIFGISGALLFIIVHAGSRLIERQREQLRSQLAESRRLSASNDDLRKNVLQAAQRSTAQSEKLMQRIGQDLHDGVAQHLSLASLRLEGAGLGPSKDADTVTRSLENAMTELRGISRGLSLPDLATLGLKGCAAQAVNDHNKGFGSNAKLFDKTDAEIDVSYAKKLCVYRFLQEALSNASRHAQATEIAVELALDVGWINVCVSDNGRGFNTQEPLKVREDGGQGLMGLSDRAATLGGHIEVTSQPDLGTEIRLFLPIVEDQE
jgi:signal transduction histidine kinase